MLHEATGDSIFPLFLTASVAVSEIRTHCEELSCNSGVLVIGVRHDAPAAYSLALILAAANLFPQTEAQGPNQICEGVASISSSLRCPLITVTVPGEK